MGETLISKDIEDNLSIMGGSGVKDETEKSSTQKTRTPPHNGKKIFLIRNLQQFQQLSPKPINHRV
ncbi:MAG: hypothetical protein HC930_16495 [Hydrococcus sp. SU_1_0]|nr:hypothetical protein [Hydrococcus sp. SU_1_0]